MKELKLCVFSDFHYWPGSYPGTKEGLKEIVRDAHEHQVDCMVYCGDFVHTGDASADFINLYHHNEWNIPAYGCIGNHETEEIDDFSSVLEAYGMKNEYEYHDINGFRLIMLDTNYYLDPKGVYHHNPPRSHSAPYKPANCLPPKELEWLRNVIMNSPNPCILCSHASFEQDCGCPQAKSVRDMIAEANDKKHGQVLMCLNGHYHRNSIVSQNGVVYFDINAVYNGHWEWQEHHGYPEEYAKRARLIPHIFLFQQPLHAFIHIFENGEIDIQGMEGSYVYGVTPESQGVDTTNVFGRKCEPRISSFHQDAVWKDIL